MRVGGPLGDLSVMSRPEDLVPTLQSLPDRGSNALLVLGSGTNVVVSDEGFPGVVLKLEGGQWTTEGDGPETPAFVVDAGVGWDDFVRHSISSGCAGIEMMSGIPGSVGAAPLQNIAAYGQQVCDVIDWVEVVDRETLEVLRLRAEECGFGFRTSKFKEEFGGRFVVSRVKFNLLDATTHPPEPSTYVDIERYFHTSGLPASNVLERRRAVLDARRRKSMLIDGDDPLSRSVGSFFINPMVPVELADEMTEQFATATLRVHYLEGKGNERLGHRRVPAAHLLRYSGFNPGDRWGPVKLSEKHLLAVVACDGARATDVWMVGAHLRARVLERTGVLLNYEAAFVGTFPEYNSEDFNCSYAFAPGADVEPTWLAGYRSVRRPLG